MRLFFWRLWALLAPTNFARTYEGPARLEVFGHQSCVGWLRVDNDAIEMLTIEGKVLWFDVRSRYRLTPFTLQNLTDHCLSRQTRLDDFVQNEAALRQNNWDELTKAQTRVRTMRQTLNKLHVSLVADGNVLHEMVARALEEDDRYTTEDDGNIPF